MKQVVGTWKIFYIKVVGCQPAASPVMLKSIQVNLAILFSVLIPVIIIKKSFKKLINLEQLYIKLPHIVMFSEKRPYCIEKLILKCINVRIKMEWKRKISIE